LLGSHLKQYAKLVPTVDGRASGFHCGVAKIRLGSGTQSVAEIMLENSASKESDPIAVRPSDGWTFLTLQA
jgi:hypothetical protein